MRKTFLRGSYVCWNATFVCHKANFKNGEETKVPIVQINILEGRTPEKKEELIKKVTDAIVDALQVPREKVRITLNEVPKEKRIEK
jgi:4-oxalocrotonate tautomerase